MNNEQTRQALQFLQDSWNQAPMRPTTLKIWGRELSKFEFEDVMRALRKLLYTSEFRPRSFSEIVAAIAGGTEESAVAAFDAVLRACALPIAERGAGLSDATRATVRRLGGWAAIGKWNDSERHFRQRDFERVFGEVTDSIRAGGAMAIANGDTVPKLITAGIEIKRIGGQK